MFFNKKLAKPSVPKMPLNFGTVSHYAQPTPQFNLEPNAMKVISPFTIPPMLAPAADECALEEDDKTIVSAFLATRHSRDMPSLETLVAMEPWVAAYIVGSILSIPGMQKTLQKHYWVRVTPLQSSSINTVDTVQAQHAIQVNIFAKELLDYSLAVLRQKSDESPTVPDFIILESLVVFINHVATITYLPKRLAKKCYDILSAFEQHQARYFDSEYFSNLIQTAMYGYLQHSIDMDLSILVDQTIDQVLTFMTPIQLEHSVERDYREVMVMANVFLEALPWDVSNARHLAILYGQRDHIKSCLDDCELREIQLAAQHMMSNCMHPADIAESGKWYRQSGARKDRDVLVAEGFEKVKAEGKIKLTGDLLANYIKLKISNIPLGLIPECCKELIIQICNKDESYKDDVWLEQAGIDAIQHVLLMNPQRYEIVRLITQLCSYILEHSTKIIVEPTALASVVKVDAPEPIEVNLPTQSEDGDQSVSTAPSDEAVKLKKAQNRWHNTWGLLLCNPSLLPSEEELSTTQFFCKTVANDALKCLLNI
ncbi:hypothetical protein BATDEDRAFT_90566 [Batrachochytrium dendrobatidis JAM81]|uniref:Uncharacterized protein n=1 Tax=Batrachochytrium dendrobatidis (strain JAM81 / FGSC 10211) TaxID=684364 RepID=F4P8M1_BATDJ|nr:uncharacterized protein BATDEDRAFT_90566 [Batrachochytrium dendrobatidis JAM81]EGF78696.1 hypothetical protein BATDEDRAFT_90566 [Batrachochytrium dendrobatidis JAM81]|eukprot:XP_006680944.1 hypothetical protein BATDEDRAFT_90566 [Batrachochytrium dendrobatidis JAM81]